MTGMRNKKTSFFQIARHCVQAVAFILFPGLFITTFSSIKELVVTIASGSFTVSSMASQIVLVAAVLLITMLMGRFFCGFLCSFGAMGDLFRFIGSKLGIRRAPITEKTDKGLKMIKYVLLIAIVVFVWFLKLPVLDGNNDPWTVFGRITYLKGPDFAAMLSIGGVLLIAIMIGSLFIERFFCRYLCPLGAVFAATSGIRLFRIRKPRRNCGNCAACTRVCAMGIPLYQDDVISSGECIDCFKCKDICPRENISANPAPAIAAVAAASAITGFYYVGNLAGSLSTGSSAYATSTVADQGPYTDGTFTGSASGYHGTTKVQVTVANGYITNITILSYGDDEQFFSKAKTTIINEIIAAQDTNVSTVSGATFSSKGIIGAVENALSGTTSSSDSAASDSAGDSPSSSSSGSASSSASISNVADGTYTGSGTGLRGTTKVTVTVSGGAITAVTIDSYQDDAEYFNRAKTTVINEIISQQSVNVSAVSGATFSSNGIMEAVANALGLEYTNTNTTNSSSGMNGHGR